MLLIKVTIAKSPVLCILLHFKMHLLFSSPCKSHDSQEFFYPANIVYMYSLVQEQNVVGCMIFQLNNLSILIVYKKRLNSGVCIF